MRIAPKEVAINDLQAVKEVHKMGSRFLKPQWYELSTGEDGNPGMFAMRHPREHAERRKMFSRQFSKKGVLEFSDLLQQKITLATSAMQRFASNGQVDLMVWWAYLATDLLGEMAFGESFHTLEIGQVSVLVDGKRTRSSPHVQPPESALCLHLPTALAVQPGYAADLVHSRSASRVPDHRAFPLEHAHPIHRRNERSDGEGRVHGHRGVQPLQ